MPEANLGQEFQPFKLISARLGCSALATAEAADTEPIISRELLCPLHPFQHPGIDRRSGSCILHPRAWPSSSRNGGCRDVHRKAAHREPSSHIVPPQPAAAAAAAVRVVLAIAQGQAVVKRPTRRRRRRRCRRQQASRTDGGGGGGGAADRRCCRRRAGPVRCGGCADWCSSGRRDAKLALPDGERCGGEGRVVN
jgi:hypothetical protein